MQYIPGARRLECASVGESPRAISQRINTGVEFEQRALHRVRSALGR